MLILPRKQDFCKKLHLSLDKVDEERYDTEAKVAKTNKEVEKSWTRVLIIMLLVQMDLEHLF